MTKIAEDLPTFSCTLYLAAASAVYLKRREREEFLRKYSLRVYRENAFCVEVGYDETESTSTRTSRSPFRIVAFMGTNLRDLTWKETMTQLKADAASMQDVTTGTYQNFVRSKYCRDASEWFHNNIMREPGAKSQIICTGHSLGGLTAMHIAGPLNLDCVTFCPGPGIVNIASPNYSGLAIHFLPAQDWVGISPGFARWQQIVVPLREKLSNDVESLLSPHYLNQYLEMPQGVDAALFEHLLGQQPRRIPDLRKNISDPARLVPDNFQGQQFVHGTMSSDRNVIENYFGGFKGQRKQGRPPRRSKRISQNSKRRTYRRR